MTDYKVWRSQHGRREWLPCNHIIKAKSDEEAQSKMRREFAKAGFHHMALLAVPIGQNPNKERI